ncbi:MAG: hypothetical protein JNJ85_12430 [Candidatus Kapabacteria bacterium]|nr:hypothetical protein [Candidatus Kapabacteria bacterium]
MFCDIHNHLLPAVDDGSQSLEESLCMIDHALEAGISHICATPHVTAYTSEMSIQQHHIQVYNNLISEIEKRSIPLKLDVGCELYFTSEFSEVAVNPIFRYRQTSNFCLVELPPTEAPPWFADICFSLIMNGVQVVLAHPERNMALLRNPFMLAKYIRTGIHTQVTAGSLVGKYGNEIQEFAQRIVKSNACTIVACDAHDTIRRPFSDIKPAYEELCLSVGTMIANRLCTENPYKILQGNDVHHLPFGDDEEQTLMRPKKKKKFLFF